MLSPRIRATLEYFLLFVAVTLFCILVVMHANYVQQAWLFERVVKSGHLRCATYSNQGLPVLACGSRMRPSIMKLMSLVGKVILRF
nr:membralin-like protein At1g60995 [Ipomoea batatas]